MLHLFMFKMVKCWIDFTSILFYFFIIKLCAISHNPTPFHLKINNNNNKNILHLFLFFSFINIIIILLFNEKLSLGVSICLNRVSIESLDLDIVKKFVTTVEKISTGFKSWSRKIEKSRSRLVLTFETPKLVRNT